MSRTSIAPAASWASWASSTAPACSIATCRMVHSRRLSDALVAQRHHARDRETRRANSSSPARAACRPRSRSASPRAIPRSTRTAPRASSATPSTPSRKDGGLAVLYGNIALDGSIVKTAGVDAGSLKFKGPARIFESQDDAVQGILGGRSRPGDVVVIRYEGPRGGPGMQEMLYPTSYLKSQGPRQGLRAGHRRALLRRHLRPLDRPRLAGSGRGRRDRPDRRRRPDRDRHSEAHHRLA